MCFHTANALHTHVCGLEVYLFLVIFSDSRPLKMKAICSCETSGMTAE